MHNQISRRSVTIGLIGMTIASACSTLGSQFTAAGRKSVKDLALIDRIAPATTGDAMRAYNIDGTEAGHMPQPELSPVMAASADANSLAWLSASSLDHYKFTAVPEPNPKSTVLYTGFPGSVRKIEFQGGYPVVLALSSGVRRIAALLRKRQNVQQLVIANLQTGEHEFDLTDRFTLKELESISLRMSGDGDRLVVIMRESFVVLDLPTQTEIVRVDGSQPSISPDGETIGYVADRHLVLYSLPDRDRKPVLPERTIYGVGAWSPDGRLLLAGAAGMLEKQLVVIEMGSNAVHKVMNIDEGALGSTFCWINKQLLS